jgi:colanic acid/amylovoran biosynthesis glycosyltransferase
MSKILVELGCDESKIIYSPAGASTFFMELESDYSSRQILAVGRFVEKKSPHSTIMAFYQVLEKHPDSKLVFAGDGPLLEVCKDLVKILKIEDSVDFVGVISQDEQRRLLQESSIFMQHSKIAPNGDSEGTPVAIVEASSAGLPIVSTKHARIIDVVQNGQTGFLVEEEDIDGMSEKIIELLNDSILLEKMGRAGKRYVNSNFTLDKHIKKIEASILGAVNVID